MLKGLFLTSDTRNKEDIYDYYQIIGTALFTLKGYIRKIRIGSDIEKKLE